MDANEIERRRLLSVEEMKRRDREKWRADYQEKCDTSYWRHGKCCAGCDHWASEMGWVGTCDANGILSGTEVLRRSGISFCTYAAPPGFPITQGDSHCGKFKDDFDWSTLDADYLTRIGAMRNGVLRSKPV